VQESIVQQLDFASPLLRFHVCPSQRRRAMSFLRVTPDMVASAAGNLENIGSTLTAANAAAAAPTTGIVAPAADDVSAALRALFGTHAQEYQALGAQASAFHEQFVDALNGGANQYVSAEAANVQLNLLNAINAPAQALLGHPLIGTAHAAQGAPVGGGGTGTSGGGGTPTTPVTGPGTSEPFSVQVWNEQTPLGPVSLTLNGTVDPATAVVTFSSAALAVPSQVPLAVDAVGPFVTGYLALSNSSQAIFNAMNSGNQLATATALFHAPSSFVNAVLFGQDTLPISVPTGAGSDFTSLGINLSVGGLFAPLGPSALTLTPTTGPTEVIPVTGVATGGLFTPLGNAL
jgi:hypothetical protein